MSNWTSKLNLFKKSLNTGTFRNVVANPDGTIASLGTAFTAATTPANNDATVLLDNWRLLSDGNDVVDVSQVADASGGSQYSMKSLVATINKKFGYIQVISNKNSVPFTGKKVSLSFQAKTTTAKIINNVRVHVLAWDGSADSATADAINAWSAQGTNPTFVANYTAENTAVNIPITTSWATYKVQGISIDTSGMTNLAVFIHIDDTDAALNDELFIRQVVLNEGSLALDYMPRRYEDELSFSAANVFADDVFRIVDNADTTKKIAFQASGITTANVRTITMADADVTLADIALNTTHRTSVGSDHTYIDQSIKTSDSPTFVDMILGAAGILYFGAAATDGTWRIMRSGNDLVIQRRESGSYVTKSTITA